ncbi:hypothetical protein BBP40_005910 [Aspergillus hancockii]|nr:hypothetical protein BBP40_005910 [Aspergillus hancockii]
MTRGEKQVFGDLLEQLGAVPKDAEAAEVQKSKLSKEDRNEMAQISEIFDSVLRELKEKKQQSSASKESTRPAIETEIPDTIQGAEMQERLWKSTYTNADVSELLDNSQISMERAIELVVRKESKNIEAALLAAIEEGRGDTGVWDICRERIFSMLQHLGDNHLAQAIGRSQDEKQTTDSPTAAAEDPQLEVPSSVSVEPVVTALYPKMLLVAFRLLNLHFPNSPLIGQFRATIRSHGRASAVLGSSTGLYNELIYFYWRGCHDLSGVVSLLKEMEVTGIEPDRRTCGLLTGIVNQRDRDLRQHWRRMNREKRSSSHEPWWDLAPNRKAMRELVGPDGWMHRFERRVRDSERKRGQYPAPIR